MSNLFARVYDDLVAVTQSDSVDDVAGPFMSLLVTASGTVKVTTRAGSVVTLAGTAVGQVIEVPVRRVWATGTNATVMGLVGGPFAGFSK